MKYLILIFFCLISFLGFTQITPFNRGSTSILARDAHEQGYRTLIVPVVSDTSNYIGVDSLGAVLYNKINRTFYFRDSITGGHKWTAFSSGSVSIPTLQQVTGVGHTTTDSINILNGTTRLISLIPRNVGGPVYTGEIRLSSTGNPLYARYTNGGFSLSDPTAAGQESSIAAPYYISSTVGLFIPKTSGNIPVSVNSNFADSFGNITLTGLPPTGAAGGDLSGTYPNPIVAQFNGQLPAYYLDRTNHTGTQSLSTITGTPTNIPFVGVNGTLQQDVATRFVYDSTNNRIGLGITPSTQIHIYRPANATSIRVQSGTSNAGIQLFANTSGGTARKIFYETIIASRKSLVFSDSADAKEYMAFDSTGYIGFNEKNPARLLHITANNGTQSQLALGSVRGGLLKDSIIGGVAFFANYSLLNNPGVAVGSIKMYAAANFGATSYPSYYKFTTTRTNKILEDEKFKIGSNGRIKWAGATYNGILTVTTNYTINEDTSSTIFVDATAGAVTITLPRSNKTYDSTDNILSGATFKIIKIDGSANNVSVVTQSTDLLNGASSLTITKQHYGYTIQNRGSNNYETISAFTDANLFTAGTGISIVSGVITSTSDLSNTNELQTLSVSNDTITISNGNYIVPIIKLSTDVTGILSIANGGSGQTTANTALNAFLPSQTSNSGKILSTDGTNTSWIAASGVGTVTSITAGAGLTGGVITTAGTIALDLTIANIFTAAQTVNKTALGVTTVDGLVLQNTTAASVGAQQITPSLHFSSFGWGTTAGTSQAVDWRINSLPVQSTVPTSNLLFQYSIAGGAYSTIFTFNSGGTLTISGPLAGASTGAFVGAITDTRAAIATTSTDGYIGTNTTAATSGVPVQISPRLRLSGTAWDGSATKTADFIQEVIPVNGTNPITSYLKISSQINAGGYNEVLRIGNFGSGGVITTIGKIVVGAPVNLKAYTVATLPSGVTGDLCYVTDALTPAFGVTLVGGGAVVTLAFYNGTNWTAR